ncbi:MAG: hypothetical protein NTW86_17990 [Candidatus Sumerlaeota bacterium]|nr:hypothetical protein [Candidatus Sumerlaeota bacterium]
MTLFGGGPLERTPSDADLARIASTYQFVNGHAGRYTVPGKDQIAAFWAGPSSGRDEQGRTIAERIKAINPAFTLSNYRNGSYVSQYCPNEAAEVETRFPLGIAVSDSGTKLVKPVGAEDEVLLLAAPSEKPRGAPAIYPFKASTTTEEHTRTTKAYVAWLRLGDEILRIDKAETGEERTIQLSVRRGIWGTKASAHDAAARVLAPVHIGSVRQGSDTSLAGLPDGKAPQPGIRYALQPQDPKFWEWLAEKCKIIFDEGYDVTWLDVSVSTWYNNGDAYGQPVVPWNIEADKPLDNPTYREYQQRKTDYLFQRFPDKRFFINNVKGSCYFKDGQDRKQFTGEVGHHPISGGSMEFYVHVNSEAQWREVAEMTLDMVRNNFWGVAWAKSEGKKMAGYRQYAYCTYLMAYEPGSRLLFGAQWPLLGRPDEMLYWDVGEPSQHFQSIDEAKRADAPGVYERQFAKGLVLVNATPEKSKSVRLGKEYYDPETANVASEVALGPFSGKLLLAP